ncbi:acyltransferase [Pedobacter sp. MC2016-05]|uniref:acyltransferase n=1 Tax=Pedobacter sp. MC2016-05 TaxID=2994474 RepID=UPI002AFF70F8|nr:acyltransferase [Pedobacter sp. MC2016-05]
MKSLLKVVKQNQRLKKIIHWILIPSGEARPRLWVSLFINPFFHKRGKKSRIRTRTRMDVLPFNAFELGESSVIEDFCTINNGVGDVKIGKETLIGMSNVIIGPVQIGNEVILAQNVVISGLNHEYENINLSISKQPVKTAPIIINDGCWIAANVVITSGVTIGEHVVIAAGSVVTKDIPSFSVAAGNPAKVIKQYNAAEKKWIRMNKTVEGN